MSYQNFNRRPIVDQSMPLVTFTVEQDVYGDEPEVSGWFIVEHSAIDNDTYIFPHVYADRQTAFAAMLDLTA
jgi:hypothetical protein